MKSLKYLISSVLIIYASVAFGQQGLFPNQLAPAPDSNSVLMTTNANYGNGYEWDWFTLDSLMTILHDAGICYWTKTGDDLSYSTGEVTVDTIFNVEGIQFSLTPSITHAEGLLHWDEDNGTLEIGMPGGVVKIQIGQELAVRMKNANGVQIDNGDVVYVSGSTGSNFEVSLADASSIATSGMFGVATEDIPASQFGYVTSYGMVRELNTSSFASGSLIWLSTTAGAMTTTKPSAPDIGVVVGVCLYSHATEGVIFVMSDVVPRLGSLSDVDKSARADTYIIYWDAASSTYKHKAESSGTDDQAISIDSTGRVFTITLEDGGEVKFEDTNTQITETDPIYTAWDKSTGISITESQISDLGTYLTTEAQTFDDVVQLGSTTAHSVGTGALTISGLVSQTGLSGSTFFGYAAGVNDDLTLNYNTGFGYSVLRYTTTGRYNAATGVNALYTNTIGSYNSAMGYYALYKNTEGGYNNSMGYNSLYANTTGDYNNAMGATALRYNTIGSNNNAMGGLALTSNTEGNNNSAIGFAALRLNTTGSNNVAVGSNALRSNLTGIGNVGIGYSAGYYETGSNKLYIENSNSTTPLIYGDFSTDDLIFNADVKIDDATSAILEIEGTSNLITFDDTDGDTWNLANGSNGFGFYSTASTPFSIKEQTGLEDRFEYSIDNATLTLYDVDETEAFEFDADLLSIEIAGDNGTDGQVITSDGTGASWEDVPTNPFGRYYLDEVSGYHTITATAAIIPIDDEHYDIGTNLAPSSGAIAATLAGYYKVEVTLKSYENNNAPTEITYYWKVNGAEPSNGASYIESYLGREYKIISITDILYLTAGQTIALWGDKTGSASGEVLIYDESVMTIEKL